jgi:hypothetical protein
MIQERNYKKDIRFIDKELARIRNYTGIKSEQYRNQLLTSRDTAERELLKKQFIIEDTQGQQANT